MRSRRVIESSQHGGKECPYLNEFQPCDYPLCHMWTVLSVSECLIGAAVSCGQGTRNRSIACLNTDGVSDVFGIHIILI